MQENHGAGKRLALSGFCLALAALGLFFVVKTDVDRVGTVMVGVLGAFFVVVAVVIYGSHLARTNGAAPVPRSVVIDEEPALFLPRAKVAAVGNCLLALALALLFAGWGVVVGLDGSWGGGALLALPGLVFLMLPVFALTGRWTAGGLWLTPTRLVHHAYGVRGWTTWDDIAKVDPVPVTFSIQTSPTSGVHTRESHGEYTTPFFRNGKLDGSRRLLIDFRDLGPSPAEVVRLLSTYWEHRELRHELGTSAALDRAGRADHRSERF